MAGRAVLVWVAAVGSLWGAGSLGWGQEKQGGTGGIGTAVEKETKGLVSEDFPEREAALARLRGLIAAQVKQRAEIQAVLDDLQTDLAKQEKALAVVSDEEARAQVAGLLEMERGIAGWTVQTMGEPMERRKALLEWGLSKEVAPVLARVYAEKKRVRLQGLKELGKMEAEGAGWTLSRLINDDEGAVRASAMAVCWDRKPSGDVVEALWYRAVAGPLAVANNEGEHAAGHVPESSGDALKVDFPGGESMDFDEGGDAGEFTDAELAADVLAHLHSPLVETRVKELVEARRKAGKSLSVAEDPDWTLVTHRLVEAYGVKEAIPILAEEALSGEADENGGDANGRPYVWSHRTMAMGTLGKLAGKDPADFQLIRVKDAGNPRGWIWAVDVNPAAAVNGNADGAAVRAFYAWWKEHHAEFGVKEEPPTSGLPRPGRGRRGIFMQPGLQNAQPNEGGNNEAATQPGDG